MVQCKDCGFLSAVFHGKHVEVTETTRETLEENTLHPRCFVRAAKFDCHGEVDSSGHTAPGSYALDLVSERVCDSFREWEQGFSPKEHVDMRMMERQEKREDARDAAAKSREDNRDRAQLWMHIIELLVIGLLVPAVMIVAQVVTTQMQIEASVKAAMKAHQEDVLAKTPLSKEPDAH